MKCYIIYICKFNVANEKNPINNHQLLNLDISFDREMLIK